VTMSSVANGASATALRAAKTNGTVTGTAAGGASHPSCMCPINRDAKTESLQHVADMEQTRAVAWNPASVPEIVRGTRAGWDFSGPKQ